jgi:signal transduction histidine kinase
MNGLFLLRFLGAYVLLQFSWWAYLLVSTGGPEAKWMVLGEGTVFATLLLVGLFRLERNLKRERDRLKRERNLLLGVTHELKTPLASVQLGVDSLRRLALSDEDRKGVLDNMQMGVTHLGRMVEDMLVATRLQHQTALQEVDFSWGDMAEDAVERTGATDLDNITLTRNLLENALKYGEGRVRVHAEVKGGKAVLSVEDEGEGIPSQDQTLAMAPFVRLREEESGTGLGLHLVGQTAALHGAQMAMESRIPKGFVVRVSWALPR